MVNIIVRTFRFIIRMIMISFLLGLTIGVVCGKRLITINFHPDRLLITNKKAATNNKFSRSTIFGIVPSGNKEIETKFKHESGNEEEYTTNHTPVFIHIVKYGETLYSIGRKYGVQFKVIMKINGIQNPKNLLANKKLKIPVIRN